MSAKSRWQRFPQLIAAHPRADALFPTSAPSQEAFRPVTSAWHRLILLPVLLLLPFGHLGCAQPGPDGKPPALGDAARPLRVVATTGMIADVAREVLGPHGEVIALMGEGVDPHLFKPTVNDVKQLARADIIFYNGLALEGRLETTLRQLTRRGRHAVAVTDVLSDSRQILSAGNSGHPDPHVWMDVDLWRQCTHYIAEVLGQLDPNHQDEYLARSLAYETRLEQLDQYIRAVIQSIPERQRILVTAHDAFHYFSRAYDIPVLAAQGINTESEPGIHDINELVEFLVQRQVPAIFVESSVSSSHLRAIQEGVASRGGNVIVGGELFSDALGPAGTYEGSYVGMMDHNATVIATALGGNVPAGGWRGLLPLPANTTPLARQTVP